MKDLLVLTTGGCSQFLVEAIGGLRDNLDVLVVDDASPKKLGIIEFCKSKGLAYISKSSPKGLTHSWNEAYKYMLKHNYNRCIISNDDVRFPKGFSRGLLDGLSQYDVICPVSNKPSGNPKMFPRQWLFNYSGMSSSPRMKSRDKIQHFLEKKYNKKPYEAVRYFNGFCFAISREIQKYMFDENNLFNPGLINTKNEIELGARVRHRGGKIGVCKNSFVFHHKGATFKKLKLSDKNLLWPNSPTMRNK